MHCEIDEMVMEVSQKYLPDLFCGRDDPRLTTHVGCGMEFMKNHQDEFDVIITDSSDPIGPASVLFESTYFNLLQKGWFTPNLWSMIHGPGVTQLKSWFIFTVHVQH